MNGGPFFIKHHGDNRLSVKRLSAQESLVNKDILDVSDDVYTFTPKSTGRVGTLSRQRMTTTIRGPDRHGTPL